MPFIMSFISPISEDHSPNAVSACVLTLKIGLYTVGTL